MDPLVKLWFFECWSGKNYTEALSRRNLGILIGSFHNPEMAKKMMDGPTVETSDEDFDAASQEILEDQMRVEQERQEEERRYGRRSRRKRRRVVNG